MRNSFFSAAWPSGAAGFQLMRLSLFERDAVDCITSWLWLQSPGEAGAVIHGPCDCDEATLRRELAKLPHPYAPGYQQALKRLTRRVVHPDRNFHFVRAHLNTSTDEVAFDD